MRHAARGTRHGCCCRARIAALPSLPAIVLSCRVVAANVGLGQMVLNASNFLRTDIVIVGIIVIGVAACMFDLLMRWVERSVVPRMGRM